jgi:hypothetical protein
VFQRRQSRFHGIGTDETEPPRNSVNGVVVRMIAQGTQHTTKEIGPRRRHGGHRTPRRELVQANSAPTSPLHGREIGWAKCRCSTISSTSVTTRIAAESPATMSL